MSVSRQLLRGRIGEWVDDPELTLDLDLYFRVLPFYRQAQLTVETFKNQTLGNGSNVHVDSLHTWNLLSAYISGVNEFIDTAIDNNDLQMEFRLLGTTPEHFEPEDVFLMIQYLALDLGSNLLNELRRLQLLIESNLSVEEIEELWPPKRPWPTILSEDDLVQSGIPLSSKQRKHSPPISENVIKRLRKKSAPPSLGPLPQSKRGSSSFLQTFMGGTASLFGASNNWVVSGNLTDSGKPLLANDPHLGLSAPGIWILNSLSSSDDFGRVVGASIPGIPFVIIGRTASIAWGVTYAGIDVQDLVRISDAGDGVGYWLEERYYQYKYREENVLLKNGSTITFRIKDTIVGPIINDIMDIPITEPVALRWLLFCPFFSDSPDCETSPSDSRDPTFDTNAVAFLCLSKTSTVQEASACFSQFSVPSLNMIFADVQGNIAYRAIGLAPQRFEANSSSSGGSDGKYPIIESNSSGSVFWKGFIPFSEMPHVVNPSSGYIITANNQIIPDTYPHILLGQNDWLDPERASRITHLLEELTASKKLASSDMKMIQMDVVSEAHTNLIPAFQRMQTYCQEDLLKSWSQKLARWTGNVTLDSIEATVFEYWLFQMWQLGTSKSLTTSWKNLEYVRLSLENESPGALEFACQALQTVLEEFGCFEISDHPKEWGVMKTVQIHHSLLGNSAIGCPFSRIAPLGGDDYTVCVGPLSYDEESGLFLTQHGPSYRQVVDFTNLEEGSSFILPLGESGNPYSPYFDNQFTSWLEGSYLPMHFEHKEQAKVVLQPGS